MTAESAGEIARLIASKSPHAVRNAKQLLNRTRTSTAADALALETELQLQLIGTANQFEAVTARISKREPSFTEPE